MATVMDHNALRGDPLLHHQSRLSQKERVAGVQLTPMIRSLCFVGSAGVLSLVCVQLTSHLRSHRETMRSHCEVMRS